MSDREIIRSFYDKNVQLESERLVKHPFEFLITTTMMDHTIRSGDSILDIGGGPGAYSLHYAAKGCSVTLVDLSAENVKAARRTAKARGLKLKAVEGDACTLDMSVKSQFDHVFLMGPMYHLLTEKERVLAMEQALARLKPGGKVYVSFILLFAGLIYYMKFGPEMVIDPAELSCGYEAKFRSNEEYSGDAFTRACFMPRHQSLRFCSNFH